MKKLFYLVREKITKLDNYSLAILLGLPIAMSLLIAFLALGGWSAIWYFNLFLPAAFIASFLSGATYIGRIVDGLTQYTEKENAPFFLKTLFDSVVAVDRQISLGEKLGTIIGGVIGLAAMAIFIGMSAPIPMIGVFSYFAHCLFGLSLVGLFAGLGSRLGSLAGKRAKAEKITFGVAAGVGLLCAVGFVALLLLFPTISVPGIWITSLLVTGTHLPVWLCGAIFAIGFTSVVTSCADYFCKAGCFLKYVITHQQATKSVTNQTVEKKIHEYRGAFVGIVLGIVLSVAVIVPLVIMPPVPIAIGGMIALGIITFMAVTSAIGSIASRIGRLLDNAAKKIEVNQTTSAAPAEKLTAEKKPEIGSTKTVLQHLQPRLEVTGSAKDTNKKEEQQDAIYAPILSVPVKPKASYCRQNTQDLFLVPTMPI